MARLLGTLLNVHLTVFAMVSGETVACVIIDPIDAGGIVGTPTKGALVNIDFTLNPFKARVRAIAEIFVDSVNALAPI